MDVGEDVGEAGEQVADGEGADLGGGDAGDVGGDDAAGEEAEVLEAVLRGALGADDALPQLLSPPDRSASQPACERDARYRGNEAQTEREREREARTVLSSDSSLATVGRKKRGLLMSYVLPAAETA